MKNIGPEKIIQEYGIINSVEDILERYMDKEILSGMATEADEEGNIKVVIRDNIKGIVRHEDFEYIPDGQVRNENTPKLVIGKMIKFVPTGVDSNGVVICSRKKAQEYVFENVIKNLRPGDILNASIVRFGRNGVYCDIGCGMIALLMSSDVSVAKIADHKKFFRNIQNLKVVVKSIDENYRIRVSHKELLGTWTEEVSNIHVGDIVFGRIISKEEYGSFVLISQNLSGLADLTDEEVNIGDAVIARVAYIKSEGMKIKLKILSKIVNQDANTEIERFNYRCKEEHIDYWRYSPADAEKVIETRFQ